MSDDVPNRGPLINGVTWTMIVLSGIFLGLRVHVKITKHRGMWWDDYICIAAWVCQIICMGLISANISLGFGKHGKDLHLSYPDVVLMSLRGVINGTFLVFGAAWSKTSFGVMLLRLTKGWLKAFIIVLLVTMNAFMYATVIANFLECNPPEKGWNTMIQGTCWPDGVRTAINIASAVYSSVCDLILAMIPWFIVVNLQMQRSEKIGVGMAMSIGVFAACTGIVRAVTLVKLRNQDFSYNGGDIVIWSIVEISVTVIAASIPVLRAFLRSVVSSGGQYFSTSGDRTDQYRTRTRGTKYGNAYGNGRSQTTCVAADRSKSRAEDGLASDAASDKSILDADAKKIMKTEAVTVSFQSSDEVGRMGYELDDLSPHHRQFPPV
ncbi:Uu.00g096240.m01.CDS01 [Anthostomella pinea]|uniref:Uu.00g096240.m01.CDS01 n=1 Tax=Anthostomella pinea TaxID=933095 RepID=A0AAI8YEX1_9PEZI|nr:Uu.00g096240.m01.CDS01 [Anthostomella pinea]